MGADAEGVELSFREEPRSQPEEPPTPPLPSASPPDECAGDAVDSRRVPGHAGFLPARRFYGWRVVAMASVVAAVTAPGQTAGVAVFTDHLIRDRPAGRRRDGAQPEAEQSSGLTGWTRREALRTRMFWAIAAGPFASGMLVTAISFHLISLLGDRGFSAAAAAAIFIPLTVGSLLATFGMGALADRVAPKLLICASMGMLAVALLGARLVTPGWTAIGFGIALGAAGGSPRAVENAAMAYHFGLAHLGSIRGLVSSMNVAASAAGPLILALGYAEAGTYGPVLLILLAIPAVVAAFAATAPPPQPQTR